MARNLKYFYDTAGNDTSGIIDDAFENGVFEPATTEEITNEIGLMLAVPAKSLVTYVYQH